MSNRKRSLSEEEIDKEVIARADDDSAWGKPARVRPPKSMNLALPSELVARAALCARMSRAASVGDWLRRIVQERIELEETAFARSQHSRDSDERERKASPTRRVRRTGRTHPADVKAKDLRRSE
jgi:hypothetical protein